MKLKLIIISAIITSCTYGQPIVNNAEDFNIGMELRFQKCNPNNISAGNAGANQVWDFSGLTSLPEITTEWMVAPAATPFGANFPAANLVEKYSDGRLVYVNKSGNLNYMVGFADTTSLYPPTYFPNPMLFVQRPLAFGTVITDTFTLSGSPALGIITINPDGWGTLILPNGTYSNVLRVKITQNHPWFSSEVYTWFDGIHASALLKMDNEPTVEYLLSETTGIATPESSKEIRVYPNPASQECVFESKQGGELFVINETGQSVYQKTIEAGKTILPSGQFSPGCYQVVFICGNSKSVSPLIIHR